MKLNRLRDARNSPFQTQLHLINYKKSIQHYYQQFLKTDLGKIYVAIPWEQLEQAWKIREAKKGPKSIFSTRAKIALMFLKHYTKTSDKKLIEQVNGNIYYQIFLNLCIEPQKPIKDYKIVSKIRVQLAQNLDLNTLQESLFKHWKPSMKDLEKCCMDATCYESDLRYPTDQKLLWEAVHWSYGQLKKSTKA